MSRLPNVDISALIKTDVPLYMELYGRLRCFIEASDEVATLPAERTLASAYGVSRITVRKALEELKTKGLVSCRQGRGYAVIRPAKGLQPPKSL